MPSPAPSVTEARIRRRAGKAVFERGAAYYRQGHVRDAQVEGNEIRGRVEGQARSPYRVRVTIGTRELEPDCTCPYEGYFCKHAVALLLHWVHRSKDFTHVESVRERLRKMDKEELVDIVVRGMRRDPNLVPPTKPRKVALGYVRSQILGLFQRHSRHGLVDYESSFDLATDLGRFHEIAKDLGKRKQHLDAARVCQVLFTTCLQNIEQVDDSAGAVCDEITHAIQECGRWTKKSKVPADEKMIRGVVDLYTGLGEDYAFTDELEDLLLDLCVPGNRTSFEAILEREIKRWPDKGLVKLLEQVRNPKTSKRRKSRRRR